MHATLGYFIHSLLPIRRWLLLVDSKEAPALDAKQDNADGSQQVSAKARYGDGYDVRCSERQHAGEECDDRELRQDCVDADIAAWVVVIQINKAAPCPCNR